jgi:peptidoglycan/LPS O-acetylase OafA/YrhL
LGSALRPSSLLEKFNSRSNNLNALRLLLATMVMASHAFSVSYGTVAGEPLKRMTVGQETFGSLAVDLFFLISGMLVTASWFRSHSMSDYLRRRVLRIYPGFIVALAFSATVAAFFSSGYRSHVLGDRGWARVFFSDSLTLDKISMYWPSVYGSNPWPGDANSPLWSVQKEFICYLLVATIGMFCFLGRRWWIFAVWTATYALYIRHLLHAVPNWSDLQGNPTDGLADRFLSYFLAGVLVWLFRDKVRLTAWGAAISFIVLCVSARFVPAFSIAFVAAGSYLVLWAGTKRPLGFTRWTQGTDISYGVYLYGWPVQEAISTVPALRSAGVNLLIAVPLTWALAFVSWHLVEHRFLRMKSAEFVDYDPGLAK